MVKLGSIFKWLIKAPLAIIKTIIFHCPGPIGHRLRARYWRQKLQYLGNRVKIDVGVYFQHPEFISIDDDSWIDRHVIILAGPDQSSRARKYIENPSFRLNKGSVFIGKRNHIAPFCILSGMAGIQLGDDCTLAAGSKLYSFSHHYRSLEEPENRNIIFGSRSASTQQYMIEGPIVLGDNVGTGLNTIILPGVSIQKESFVAINSVVYSSFNENSFLKGDPAKYIKPRFKT